MESAWVAKVSIWVLGLISAALGSAFSLFVDKDKLPQLTKWARIFTFLFGLCIGFIGGGAINEFFSIPTASFSAFSIQFFIGWAGIAILTELKLQVPLAINALRRKYFGD